MKKLRARTTEIWPEKIWVAHAIFDGQISILNLAVEENSGVQFVFQLDSHNMSDKVFQVITAASKGSLEDLKKAFASDLSANIMDYDRRTPLHLAAAEGHLETVKYLVEEKKVDINATDR